MSDTVIQVNSLSKSYRLGTIGGKRLVDDVNRWWAKLKGKPDPLSKVGQQSSRKITDLNGDSNDEIWALRNVTFEVNQGEVLGIIGHNGAGKSTLLKILSRVTAPTDGDVRVKGRIASLLEVGTGFHPELTGRENIYLNGAILGMTKNEVRQKFDEIVAFSEVEKFIDTPVKRYSSGMHVKLAFAVAAHLDPEIMIIDEVLAVGDAKFQKKCLTKMGEIAKRGCTVLFVSHNMGSVNTLCTRVVHFANGEVQAIGSTREIVSNYLANLFENKVESLDKLRLPGSNGQLIRFRDIRIANGDEAKLIFAQPVEFLLTIDSDIDVDDLSIGSSIFSIDGNCIGSMITKEKFNICAGQQITLRLTMSDLMLAPGSFYSGFSIGYNGGKWGHNHFDAIIGRPAFQILPISNDESDQVAHWHPSWGKVVFRDNKLRVEDVVDTAAVVI